VSGRIAYDGFPGPGGEYQFATQSGDIEVSIPASSLVEVKSQSSFGHADDESKPNNPTPGGKRSLLLKSGSMAIPRFVLRSFAGRIRVKRP